KRFHRRVARKHRFAVSDDLAGAALLECAAELRRGQTEVVAQDVEERRLRVDLDAMHASVDVEGDRLRHRCELSSPLRDGVNRASALDTRFESSAPPRTAGRRLPATAI